MYSKKCHLKLRRELDWLLKHEVPQVVEPLELSISRCVKSFALKSSSKLKLICVSSSSGVEAIRGSVVLLRDTLCSMELFLKPAKTQSSIKASFRSDKQWKLQQVHDALNHLQKAFELLSMIKQSPNSHSPQGIVSVLDEVIKHLVKCRSRLVLPSPLSLPSLVGGGFTKMFAPSLPGDTLMNVFVVEDHLVVTHYTVQQAHINASLNPTKNSKFHNLAAGRSLFHPVGSILEYGGARYEVSTANKAECAIPLLTNTLLAASNAQLLCQNLKDKLLTLNSCWGVYKQIDVASQEEIHLQQ